VGERLSVAGLFAGIGGIELGFQRAGHESVMLCECWDPARATLDARFPNVPVEPDVRALRSLPKTDVVTAGFPCQDLSQAGRTKGIRGRQSGLVGEVFRLLSRRHPRWLVLENVLFMLQLDRGRAMKYLVDELEAMNYRWAYRVVDSRFAGVPQRRQRVLFVASRTEDPRAVLFADDSSPRDEAWYRDDAYGFYWTEGLRGLGWARDAVPTLKGGSTIGIGSPPAVWLPRARSGRRFLLPTIEDGEALQGFLRGWTAPARHFGRSGDRWKLVGNAVTVGVAQWLGKRLAAPGTPLDVGEKPHTGGPWPSAAYGSNGVMQRVDLSMWPRRNRYRHLADVLNFAEMKPLSHRGATGFRDRLDRGNLYAPDEFRLDLKDHVERTG
jgi:DNA (cytosine-5)-methyltransferase 1